LRARERLWQCRSAEPRPCRPELLGRAAGVTGSPSPSGPGPVPCDRLRRTRPWPPPAPHRGVGGGLADDVLGPAERAAARFPAPLCVGVDLLPAVRWRRFAVGEVTARGEVDVSAAAASKSARQRTAAHGTVAP